MQTLAEPTAGVALDEARAPRLGLLTRGLQRVPTLPALLHEWRLVHGAHAGTGALDAVLAWGHRPSAAVAEQHAQRHGLPLLRAEDGFLRSVELGHRSPPLSIVFDDLGMHFDASRPSRLERLIAQPYSPARDERARALLRAWVECRVSKYNHARDAALDVGAGPCVLVVDQTEGDASIAASGASAASFHAMLDAALDEHPHARVLLKVHPDVIAGRKRGHFGRLSTGQAQRVHVIGHDVHPTVLLERCEAVYVVGSLMGFEALLWQRPVRCFGMPFYAGWGLTRDEMPAPARRRAVPLEALVHAALVDYSRCLDPETGAACSAERLIAHLTLQRRMRARFAPRLQALGFSRWKVPIATAFFGGSELEFLRRESQPAPEVAHDASHDASHDTSHDAPHDASRDSSHGTGRRQPPLPYVVWGAKPAPNVPRTAGDCASAVIRVEDGFIRSVGLGADLTRPLSWVQDDLGIYFDATKPSRLEVLLQEGVFTADLLQRAGALRHAIVSAGITKYNVGAGTWTPPRHDRVLVLVPGQVESDASIAFGAATIRGNLELLRAARAMRPDAHLIYKPHPDVLAGLRGSRAQAQRALDACREHCDEIVTDTPMGCLLDAVHEVHTLTSLAGFEALLRGKAVVTWGLPFYAGWGLTDDRAPAHSPALQRRTRHLELDELVAATLILYPAYVSRASGAFTTPERALHELVEWRSSGAQDVATSPWRRMSPWRRIKRGVLRLAARLRGR